MLYIVSGMVGSVQEQVCKKKEKEKKMGKCNVGIVIWKRLKNIYFSCQLEKDHKGKHRYEGKSEGKLFIIEWWNELPVIEGLAEMYVAKGGIKE